MALSLEACSAQEWFEKFKLIDPQISGETPFFPANIFFSQQYYGLELTKVSFRSAYALNCDGETCAWLLTYPLSDTTIRLRGIFVAPAFRNKGMGRALIQAVCQAYKDRYRYAGLFVPESMALFYQKCGFTICPDFTPRKVEFFNSETQTYDLEKGESFYFMKKDLSTAVGIPF